MSAIIPETHFDLLDQPVVVQLATVMPDGSPQVTPVWANRVGNQVWVNSARGRLKDRNMRARPQATVAIMAPDNPYRWLEVRGKVVEIVEGDAAEAHIDGLSNAYFGRPKFVKNDPEEVRVIYKIEPVRVNAGG